MSYIMDIKNVLDINYQNIEDKNSQFAKGFKHCLGLFTIGLSKFEFKNVHIENVELKATIERLQIDLVSKEKRLNMYKEKLEELQDFVDVDSLASKKDLRKNFSSTLYDILEKQGEEHLKQVLLKWQR